MDKYIYFSLYFDICMAFDSVIKKYYLVPQDLMHSILIQETKSQKFLKLDPSDL